MDKLEREEKELKQKIEFCSMFLQYGNLVNSTPAQSTKAFEVKKKLEEELRVLKLKMGK